MRSRTTCRSLRFIFEYAVAPHAGAVARNDKAILVPGATGSGKSSLIAWLVDRAFDYLTDEITLLVHAGANVVGLPRAMVIKPGADKSVLELSAFAGAASIRSAEQLMLEAPGGKRGGPVSCGLIVFPEFSDGAEIRVEALSAAAAALRLMACNLNARNLPDGGFAAINKLARSAPAVSLVYGAYGQLEGVIDTLAHTVLNGDRDPAEMRRFLSASSSASKRAPLRCPASIACHRTTSK